MVKIRSPRFLILIFIILIYPYFVLTFEFCPPYRFPGFLTYLKIPVLGIPDQLHFAVVLDAGLRGRGSSDHPKKLSLPQPIPFIKTFVRVQESFPFLFIFDHILQSVFKIGCQIRALIKLNPISSVISSCIETWATYPQVHFFEKFHKIRRIPS